jgi:hypothetical protein
MLQPTKEHFCLCCFHTHFVRGGSLMLQPTMRRYLSTRVRRLQHQEPTSHEVGMRGTGLRS